MKKFLWLLAIIAGILLIPISASASSDQLIIINKSNNQLAFFDNGEIVRTFSVGTGRTSTLTPEGVFPIVNKIKNRPYYTDGIAGGDPRNPLGDRWLGLNARGTYGTTYAIHGNNNASSIGGYVSAGCVRMHNQEVRWLYDRVKVGTNVVILRSSKSFTQIAQDYGYQMRPPIKVIVDGKQLSLSADPIEQSGRVLVPMRNIFDSLGATVRWNQSAQTITATHRGKEIKLTVGSKRATVDGRAVTLDVAPTVQRGVTFVPTRFVAESLNVGLGWSNATRTVTLTNPVAKPPAPAVPAKTNIEVHVNGSRVVSKSDGIAFVQSGVTYVPMRNIFEWLDATVAYDGATSTATAYKGSTEFSVTAGTKSATLNGQPYAISHTPFISKGTLHVPVRAVTNVLGGSLSWDQQRGILSITAN
ncbi:L,D-transpeptidase family protein [Paenalkalicoccus suaedae]|uniref:L,D-transpeptidase family protein n=1 Tax=Paenalkalicoccus suaedae TaxID=2592382 RepID=A0A859FBU1_9BACI|nr:stalk domain-containing protein [Paenalkalicoccus suaedae]QKS70517.1 L,D-transpeptidase family protein [Paenalkalicoccus suaedae]